MVFIKNPDNLKVDFDIMGSVNYDISQERVGIKFDLRVKYNGDSQRQNFGIAVSRNEIDKVKTILEKNRNEVHKELEEIKAKLKPLLDLGETVEVSLEDISERLLQIAKSGLEDKIKKKELDDIARKTRTKRKI